MAVTPGQQTGRLLLVQIGDGVGPETFTNLCGLMQRSFNLSANDVDTTVPDCDNPGNTPQKTGVPGILNRTFTGSGKFVAGANQTAFMAYVVAGSTFNAKVIVPGLGTFTGPFYVTNFELGGEMEGTMTFNATFNAGGALTFVAE
ncbi:phage tail tube protein [Mesorhizobium sp. B2-5-7]|uniref:phage tail tube protein n=1 Tax=Mesorhizobium sp. B2-5-7 TaxID=2589923 RepID=UPI00112950D6|nr:phage tail tube protein [Mesorhizobium sp. B2-5-7]TPK18060.1 phage tail protein [Mesorhizobium sp. B2-5-7]